MSAIDRKASALRERLRDLPADPKNLTGGDWTRNDGTADQRTLIAEYKAQRLLSLRQGVPFDLSVLAVEQQTADGSEGSETFTLSHDLVESNMVATHVLCYGASNGQLNISSVDYDADSVTVDGAGPSEDLGFIYTAGAQALLEVQKVAPNGTPKTLFSEDVGMIHRRDQGKEPVMFDFEDWIEPLVPQDWKLEVYVDAPYRAALSATDVDGDNSEESAPHALISVPFYGAPGPVEGAGEVVRYHAAGK